MTRERDRLLAEFAAAHHAVFATEHARLIGFSDREVQYRVEQGMWNALYLNVFRIAGAPPTWRGDLLAACWAGGFRAVASHRSAAALWGLPGARRNVAEITCPRWLRGRHPAVVVHETNELGQLDITEIDGIPVSRIERTLLDIAAVCGERTVDMALDSADRRELTKPADIRAMLIRVAKPGRRGVRKLRRLLDMRTPERRTPESEAETQLLRVLRTHGLPDPVLQYEIYDGDRFVARVDAAYVDRRIAIEYESYQEHVGKLPLIRDSARRNHLLAIDWETVCATAADLATGGDALAADIHAIRRRRAVS